MQVETERSGTGVQERRWLRKRDKPKGDGWWLHDSKTGLKESSGASEDVREDALSPLPKFPRLRHELGQR